MAIRNIRVDDDPVLRKRSRPVEKFDARLTELLDDMAHTMYDANGVGLAGVQVGVLRRVVVVDCSEECNELIELVNPEIIETSGEQTGQEGCLSLPGRAGIVRRPMKVKVRAQNRYGKWYEIEGEGLLARAFCHEIAHLDGGLFIDVMDEEIVREDAE